jgi:hypothetical protein
VKKRKHGVQPKESQLEKVCLGMFWVQNAVLFFVTRIYKPIFIRADNTSLNEYWRKLPCEAATPETLVSQYIHLLTTTAARVLNRVF